MDWKSCAPLLTRHPAMQELDRIQARGQMGAKSPLLWDDGQVEEYLAGSPLVAEIKERLKASPWALTALLPAAHTPACGCCEVLLTGRAVALVQGIEKEYAELDTVWFMAGSLFKSYPYDVPTEAFSLDVFRQVWAGASMKSAGGLLCSVDQQAGEVAGMLTRTARMHACVQAFAAVQASVVHLQGVTLSKRFALVPLGPPLLTYSSTAKACFRRMPCPRAAAPVHAWPLHAASEVLGPAAKACAGQQRQFPCSDVVLRPAPLTEAHRRCAGAGDAAVLPGGARGAAGGGPRLPRGRAHPRLVRAAAESPAAAELRHRDRRQPLRQVRCSSSVAPGHTLLVPAEVSPGGVAVAAHQSACVLSSCTARPWVLGKGLLTTKARVHASRHHCEFKQWGSLHRKEHGSVGECACRHRNLKRGTAGPLR